MEQAPFALVCKIFLTMIIAKMEDCERYYALHPLLEKFFEYVKTHDFSEAKAGRIEIMGKQMFINFEDMDLQPREERPLEVHRRYIDVQIRADTVKHKRGSGLATAVYARGRSRETLRRTARRCFLRPTGSRLLHGAPG